MKPAQAVGVLVGVALMVAPALLGYAEEPAADLHRTAGPVAASLALIAFWEATRSVRWPNVVIALALLVAPLLGGHPRNAAVTGVVAAVVLGVATPFGGERAHRFAGGWVALLRPSRRAAEES